MSDTTTTPALVSEAAPSVVAPAESTVSTEPQIAAEDTSSDSEGITDTGDPLDAIIADALHDVGIDFDHEEEGNAAPVEAAEPEPEPQAAQPKAEDKKDDDLGPALNKHGKENRIPYSRVQKIAENAETKGYQKATTEFAPKIEAYESRLNQVSQVENLMFQKPAEFLSMLISKVPGYAEVFSQINQSLAPNAGNKAGSDFSADYQLEDGTPFYSDAKMKAILKAHADQVEARLAERYKPIEERFRQEQRQQAMMPAIRAQLAEAVKWPLFNESQNEILAVLKADQKISLEGAYRQVVMPKLAADRNKLREDLIKEINTKPIATGTKGAPAKNTATPNLDDQILNSIRKAGIKLE